MKQKIHQIISDMRRQPLVSGVTFIATVMTIFLFMVVVITTRVHTIPFAPESCRDRLLLGKYIHVVSTDGRGDSSGNLSTSAARRLYNDLDGVEQISFFGELEPVVTGGTAEKNFDAFGRQTDAAFFRVFDHKLVAGRFYTDEEAASNLHMVVISERTARKAFGTVDCVGKAIDINHDNYTVTGVVKDHSFLATNACSDIFIAKGYDDSAPAGDLFGMTLAAMKVRAGVDFSHIREQVKARYAILDTELAPVNKKTVYHEAPFDQKTIAGGLGGSNTTPDSSGSDLLQYALYAILLIVPAINLSSLLHSRMHRRISEIGVRRAFGCTRRRVITDVISENFLVTLAGGIIGVGLGIVFAMNYSGLYENMDNFGSGVTPSLEAVINWETVAVALLVCFVLNIISASVPAWQASRVNPVEAINSK